MVNVQDERPYRGQAEERAVEEEHASNEERVPFIVQPPQLPPPQQLPQAPLPQAPQVPLPVHRNARRMRILQYIFFLGGFICVQRSLYDSGVGMLLQAQVLLVCILKGLRVSIAIPVTAFITAVASMWLVAVESNETSLPWMFFRSALAALHALWHLTAFMGIVWKADATLRFILGINIAGSCIGKWVYLAQHGYWDTMWTSVAATCIPAVALATFVALGHFWGPRDEMPRLLVIQTVLIMTLFLALSLQWPLHLNADGLPSKLRWYDIVRWFRTDVDISMSPGWSTAIPFMSCYCLLIAFDLG